MPLFAALKYDALPAFYCAAHSNVHTDPGESESLEAATGLCGRRYVHTGSLPAPRSAGRACRPRRLLPSGVARSRWPPNYWVDSRGEAGATVPTSVLTRSALLRRCTAIQAAPKKWHVLRLASLLYHLMILQVSEDHCWVNLDPEGGREGSVEVTTDTASKRGKAVSEASWRGWLYTGGHAVLCCPQVSCCKGSGTKKLLPALRLQRL